MLLAKLVVNVVEVQKQNVHLVDNAIGLLACLQVKDVSKDSPLFFVGLGLSQGFSLVFIEFSVQEELVHLLC